MEPPVPLPQVLNAIQSVAPYVASIGTAFEALALQKNASLPAFQFLRGGEGSDYYSWKIRALRAAKKDNTGLAIGQRTRPLSVGERGLLLGEGDSSADPATAAASNQPKIATTTDIAGEPFSAKITSNAYNARHSYLVRCRAIPQVLLDNYRIKDSTCLLQMWTMQRHLTSVYSSRNRSWICFCRQRSTSFARDATLDFCQGPQPRHGGRQAGRRGSVGSATWEASI